MISVIRNRFGLLSLNISLSRLKIKLTSDKVRALNFLVQFLLYICTFIFDNFDHCLFGVWSIPIFSHTVPWYAWANRLGICGLMLCLV